MFALIPLLFACAEPPPPPSLGPWALSPWRGDGETRVVVDLAHSRTGDPELAWDADEFGFREAMSNRILLDDATRHGVRYRVLREGPVDETLLADTDVLWITVPGHFRKPALEAIHTWVEGGGGLFVSTEVDNMWGHTAPAAELLAPFGITPLSSTARELEMAEGVVVGIPGPPGVIRNGEVPLTLDRERGMPLVRTLSEHPVTAGVRVLAFDGTAAFAKESEGGVGFLTDVGYADLGDKPADKPSNGRRTMSEPQGAGVPVVLAKTVGKGRVVVVGDPALVSNAWLGMADDRRFGLNTLQWLSGRDAEDPWRDAAPGRVTVGFEQSITGWSTGLRDAQGFHHFFHDLSREPGLLPLALPDASDAVDVLGFIEPRLPYTEEQLTGFRTRLEGGQRMVLVTNVARPGLGSGQLLAILLPDVLIEGSGGKLKTTELNPEVAKDVVKPVLDVWGTAKPAEGYPVRNPRIAALTHAFENYTGRRGEDVKPKRYRKGQPYLFDVRMSGGEALLQAELPDGTTVDVIRRYEVGQGELIVMMQGEIWGGRTLPTVREPVIDMNQPAYDSVLDFAAWLARASE